MMCLQMMLVMHAWLPHCVAAQQMLVKCLVRPVQPDPTRPPKKRATTSKLLQVEFAFSGKPLTSISAELPACLDDTASFVANLQNKVAKTLDEIAPTGRTTLGHDVRLFCGHNGLELTWPELALLPHQAGQACVCPTGCLMAMKQLACGSVLVAARSDVGSLALQRFMTKQGL